MPSFNEELEHSRLLYSNVDLNTLQIDGTKLQVFRDNEHFDKHKFVYYLMKNPVQIEDFRIQTDMVFANTHLC